MHALRSLLLACPLVAVSIAAHAQISPNEAMQRCKNAAGDRLPNVPRASIDVQFRTEDYPNQYSNNYYMITFRSTPPNGRQSSGLCTIAWYDGRVQNLQFDAPMDTGSNNTANGGDDNDRRITVEQALETCRNTVSEQLPGVPRALIDVDLDSRPEDRDILIAFHPHGSRDAGTSGTCFMRWNGSMIDFDFSDPPVPPGANNNSFNHRDFPRPDPTEAMRFCKATLSRHFPSVPLASIAVDNPRPSGGHLLSVFRIRAPNGSRSDGTCEIGRNGGVNLSVR